MLSGGSRAASFDGTGLHVERFDGGPGAPVLLCNGIGAGLAMWTKLIPAVTPARPFVTWSYRGLHESDEPVTERLDTGAHVEDAIAVMDSLQIEKSLVLAWSSGGPIGLQLAHDHPERVEGVAFLCAVIGNPARLLRHLEIAGVLPFLAGVAKYFHEPLQAVFRSLVHRAEVAGLVRQSGFIGPATDVGAVVTYLRELASCDAHRLMQVYEAVARESYDEVIAGVWSPAVVIGGDKDRWTTPRLTGELARRLPDARKKIYEAGTHFLPDEFPEEIAEDLNRFFAPAAPS